MPEPTAEERRAALVEQIARLVHAEQCAEDDCAKPNPEDRCTVEAVLALLESGEAGVWLVPADGLQGVVAVVVGQLRLERELRGQDVLDRLAAEKENVQLRAELRDRSEACARLAVQRADLHRQVNDLLPYADAGAEALAMWEPYGASAGHAAAHAVLCEDADRMLTRIRAGEFGGTKA